MVYCAGSGDEADHDSHLAAASGDAETAFTRVRGLSRRSISVFRHRTNKSISVSTRTVGMRRSGEEEGAIRLVRRTILGSCPLFVVAGCLEVDTGGNARHDQEPGDVFGAGEITVIIDGEELDLSSNRFQAEHADDYALEFHLHEFDDYWYMEGDERVTVSEGLDKLPSFSFKIDDGESVLTIDEQTYDARAGETTIEVRVNNETVEPAAYTLDDGDEIEVIVSTG